MKISLTILAVLFAISPAFAQNKSVDKASAPSAPSASLPMPGESGNFTPTLDRPVETLHFVEPAPIVTSEHLEATKEKEIIFDPFKPEPIHARGFSLWKRPLELAGLAYKKADDAVATAEKKSMDVPAYHADGKNVKQRTRLVWGKP